MDNTPTVLLDLPSEPDMVKGIMKAAHRRGWRLFDLKLTDYLPIPTHLKAVGAIVTQLPGDPLVRGIRKLGCPIVRITESGRRARRGLPTVGEDQLKQGVLAARFFSDRGFEHLAYVGHRPWGSSRDLYEGLADEAKKLKCECHLLQLLDNVSTSDRRSTRRKRHAWRVQMVAWMSCVPKPFGLLLPHDTYAARLCAIAEAEGLAVPEDVAILGRGNKVYTCESAQVELSSIDTAKDQVGRQAVRLLHRLIRGETPPAEPILVPPRGVVERHSTDVLAVPDPAVARALRFIWDNLAKPISVDDIANQAAVSRSTLVRGFRKCLGRGINAELVRKRVEACARLLKTTDMKVHEIAPRVGFNSTIYLRRAFQKVYGVTPTAFRKQRRPKK